MNWTNIPADLRVRIIAETHMTYAMLERIHFIFSVCKPKGHGTLIAAHKSHIALIEAYAHTWILDEIAREFPHLIPKILEKLIACDARIGTIRALFEKSSDAQHSRVIDLVIKYDAAKTYRMLMRFKQYVHILLLRTPIAKTRIFELNKKIIARRCARAPFTYDVMYNFPYILARFKRNYEVQHLLLRARDYAKLDECNIDISALYVGIERLDIEGLRYLSARGVFTSPFTVTRITREILEWAREQGSEIRFSGYISAELYAELLEFNIVYYFSPYLSSPLLWSQVPDFDLNRLAHYISGAISFLKEENMANFFRDLKKSAYAFDIEATWAANASIRAILANYAHVYFPFTHKDEKINWLLENGHIDAALRLHES